eukprot:scaffold7190_cov193-Amphora_coffeaeformis.AAC.8
MLRAIQTNTFFRNRCEGTSARRIVLIKDYATLAVVIHKSNTLGNTGPFFAPVIVLGFVIVVLGVDGKKVIERIRELKPLALAFKEAFNVGRGLKEHAEILL